jgi:hypothetical protein
MASNKRSGEKTFQWLVCDIPNREIDELQPERAFPNWR